MAYFEVRLKGVLEKGKKCLKKLRITKLEMIITQLIFFALAISCFLNHHKIQKIVKNNILHVCGRNINY